MPAFDFLVCRPPQLFIYVSKTGITSTGLTKVTGDMGTSPITGAAITGFALGSSVTPGVSAFKTSTLVTGKVYAADYTAAPGTTPAKMTAAISDMEAAYTYASTRAPATTMTGVTISDSLAAGTLTGGGSSGGGVVTLSVAATLTFDAQGDPNAVWILQTTGGLNFMAGSQVVLAGGAKATNIFWVVSGVATIGAGAPAPGTHAKGVILSKTGITMTTGGELTALENYGHR